MGSYNEIDIEVSPSGDLVIDSDKDLKLAKPSGVLLQDIVFRARTEDLDFEPHPHVGADLQVLVGEPNTKANAETAEDKLLRSLTKDGRIIPNDVRVKAVPISLSEIALYTFVNSSNYNSKLFTTAVLNYTDGINVPGGGQ